LSRLLGHANVCTRLLHLHSVSNRQFPASILTGLSLTSGEHFAHFIYNLIDWNIGLILYRGYRFVFLY